MRHSYGGSAKVKQLNLANMQQKIIFLTEMQGQLSDGYWENTEPLDHWQPWCGITWDDVQVDPNNIGVVSTGWLKKRNYGFNRKDLLEVVGDRIRFKINLYLTFGEKILGLLKENDHILPDGPEVPKYQGEYWDKVRTKLQEVGLTEENMREAYYHGSYTPEDLRRDCLGLNRALKVDARAE